MKHVALFLLLSFALSTFAATADCISIEQAAKQVGSKQCVTGKVVKVGHTPSGTTFLDFCEDEKSCPFVVVIFATDLRDVGDVKKLEGKTIEVSGKIEQYKGRAEIVLKEVKQLRGDAAKLPPLPKSYDVEKHGRFSATSPLPTQTPAKKTTTTKQYPGGTADDNSPN